MENLGVLHYLKDSVKMGSDSTDSTDSTNSDTSIRAPDRYKIFQVIMLRNLPFYSKSCLK